MQQNSAGNDCKKALTEEITDPLVRPLLGDIGVTFLEDLRVIPEIDRKYHIDWLVDHEHYPYGVPASVRCRCEHERHWKDFTQTTLHKMDRNGRRGRGEFYTGRSALLILAYIRHPRCYASPGEWEVTEILLGNLAAMRRLGPERLIEQNREGNGQQFGTCNYERHPELVIARSAA